MRDEIIDRLSALAVEEEAIAFDIRHLPPAPVALEERIEEVRGDLLAVLDAHALQKRRVAADVR